MRAGHSSTARHGVRHDPGGMILPPCDGRIDLLCLATKDLGTRQAALAADVVESIRRSCEVEWRVGVPLLLASGRCSGTNLMCFYLSGRALSL